MTPDESLFGVLSGAGIVFALAVSNVALFTVRVTLTTRGRAKAASTIAAFESALFVIVFSRIVSSLTSPVSITAYALGVGAGTYCGIMLDRLSRSQENVCAAADTPLMHVNPLASAHARAVASSSAVSLDIGRRAARQRAYLRRT